MMNSEPIKYHPSISIPAPRLPLVSSLSELTRYSERRWIGCVRSDDNTIYLLGGKKIAAGGAALSYHTNSSIDQLSMMVRPEGAFITQPSFFLALDGYVQYDPSSGYTVKTWRSGDDLHTLTEGIAPVLIPAEVNDPSTKIDPFCVSRNLLQMPDGSLMATAYGCFDKDRVLPEDRHSQIETPYKTRAFLLVSRDQGASWQYHATIARPIAGDPVGEGFNEPTMVRLDDGRLFCILRTGHYSPLYGCWSSDEGLTWTEPLYTGLERGCFPCLLKLADGRLAMTFGQRFPAGWSRVTPLGDWPRYEPILPGVGLVCLAINADGTGESWDDVIVGHGMGSCYSTTYEVVPNRLFCQVDGVFWWMRLAPRQNA
ncbi:MAG: sialidase family protein [Anaerolineae bacterium]